MHPINYCIEIIMFLSNRNFFKNPMHFPKYYKIFFFVGKILPFLKKTNLLLFVNFYAHSEIMSLTAPWTQLSLYFLHPKKLQMCACRINVDLQTNAFCKYILMYLYMFLNNTREKPLSVSIYICIKSTF